MAIGYWFLKQIFNSFYGKLGKLGVLGHELGAEMHPLPLMGLLVSRFDKAIRAILCKSAATDYPLQMSFFSLCRYLTETAGVIMPPRIREIGSGCT